MAKARKSKVVKTRKNAVPKTRNSGTMTEAAFWSFIRSALRQKSRWWKPVSECKQNARRIYAGPLKRQKWEFQCNYCKKWFKDKDIAVDHIIPAGALNCCYDLPEFVERLFCEAGGLQVLCANGENSCHHIKTQSERKNKRC